MTLLPGSRARSVLRVSILGAALFSFSATAALASNVTTVHQKPGAKPHAAKTHNGYRPRTRIKHHPRNRDRKVGTYVRDGRKVRIIDTANSGYRAPRTEIAQRRGVQQKTGGRDFGNRLETLTLRYLRETIDALEYENARIRAADHLARIDGTSADIAYSDVPQVGYVEEVPILPTEGLLTEVARENVVRPRAEITQVTESQKIAGERKAAARARRFNRENLSPYFRFYRENEAYDVRYPSVVYLNSH